MSVANFAEFCSLLAQQDWNEIEIEKIKQTAERRQDYLTRKLDENLCVECKRYNESEVRCKRHGSDQVSHNEKCKLFSKSSCLL